MFHSQLEEKGRGFSDIIVSEDDPQVPMSIAENFFMSACPSQGLLHREVICVIVI